MHVSIGNAVKVDVRHIALRMSSPALRRQEIPSMRAPHARVAEAQAQNDDYDVVRTFGCVILVTYVCAYAHGS